MKEMKLTHILRNGLIALSAVFALTACTENVDMSNPSSVIWSKILLTQSTSSSLIKCI